MADNLTAIDAHAKLTCMDSNLYKAAFGGTINSFQDVSRESVELLLTPNKNTVLHVHFTAHHVSREFVQHIRNLCPPLVLKANSKGETPLHIAAKYGHLIATETLIDLAKTLPADEESGIGSEKKLLRSTNQEGDSALHEAVRYNHIQVVRLLTKEDPVHPHRSNKDGETPLYIAAERGYRDVVMEILKNCGAPAYDGPDGRTALHAAVIRKDLGMVKMLLEKEHLKSSITKADDSGRLPLHMAQGAPFKDLTELLLKKDKTTAYMKDSGGRTALHVAAQEDNLNTIKVIISNCPDCAEIVDNNGQNALHYAITNYRYSAAKFILEEASLSNLYSQKDAVGNTPVHSLASSKLHYSKSHQLPVLIGDQRVDKLAFNKENRTAYDIALDGKAKGRYEMLENMHKFGVSAMSQQRIKVHAGRREDQGRNQNRNDDDEDPLVKRAKESHLIAATLIATVTFAAGFTLPGGTFQDGKGQGTSILRHKAAFQAFIVTDTLAMVLSATAVLIHLFLALSEEKFTRRKFLASAFTLTMFAMTSMMIAFVTGTFAMLGDSLALGIVIILIGLSFFIPCFLILKAFGEE